MNERDIGDRIAVLLGDGEVDWRPLDAPEAARAVLNRAYIDADRLIWLSDSTCWRGMPDAMTRQATPMNGPAR
jgi:hypothetical protein